MRGASALALLLALAGCGGPSEAPAAAAEPAETAPPSEGGDAVTLSPDAETVYRRTLVRDATPPCDSLTEGVADPGAALLEVTERAPQPPSSGIRAATCLILEHAPAHEAVLVRWVSERATMGFGLLVLNHLGELEPELRERLIAAALAGEYSDAAGRRVDRYRETSPPTVVGEPTAGPLGE